MTALVPNPNQFTAAEDCLLLYIGYQHGLQAAPIQFQQNTTQWREGKVYNARIGELNGTAPALGLGKPYDTISSRWDVGAIHRVIQFMTEGNYAATASIAARVVNPVVRAEVLVRNRVYPALFLMLMYGNSNSSTNRLLLSEHDLFVLSSDHQHGITILASNYGLHLSCFQLVRQIYNIITILSSLHLHKKIQFSRFTELSRPLAEDDSNNLDLSAISV